MGCFEETRKNAPVIVPFLQIDQRDYSAHFVRVFGTSAFGFHPNRVAAQMAYANASL
jgi:hypothetical protein